jgi:hypothetical protein
MAALPRLCAGIGASLEGQPLEFGCKAAFAMAGAVAGGNIGPRALPRRQLLPYLAFKGPQPTPVFQMLAVYFKAQQFHVKHYICHRFKASRRHLPALLHNARRGSPITSSHTGTMPGF